MTKTDIAIDGRYDTLYESRDGAPLWGPAPGRLIARINEFSEFPGTALDAGCGDGKNALFLAQQGWRVRGFDTSGAALSLLEDRLGAAGFTSHEFCRVDLESRLAQDEDHVDLVISYGLFHCLPKARRVAVHRALQSRARRGGLVVFACLMDGLDLPADHHTPGLQLATYEEIEELKVGFDVLYEESGEIREHHLPLVGPHVHAGHWIVMRRQT